MRTEDEAQICACWEAARGELSEWKCLSGSSETYYEWLQECLTSAHVMLLVPRVCYLTVSCFGL